MKKEILQVLDDLLKIQSVSSDIEKLDEVTDYIKQYFDCIENCYIDVLRFNDKPSIVVKNFDGKKADIILNGHYDVVPPSEDGQFEPKEIDGKIYARGSGDMKAWDAVMMVLMKEILLSEKAEKKVALILTSDEELGWLDGAAKIVEEWYRATEGVLVPDSGSLEEIVVAEKWMLDIEVDFKGLSCHASRPWLWENAIENAYAALKELRKKLQDDDELFKSEDNWGTSVSMTKIESGTATNVIPNNARASFDIRFTEKYTMEKILEKIYKIIDRHHGQIVSTICWDLVHTPEESDFVQSYMWVYESIMWSKPTVVKEHGASDGRFFSAKWMPLLLHRPTCENIHSKNEWVDIEATMKIYEIYREFILGK